MNTFRSAMGSDDEQGPAKRPSERPLHPDVLPAPASAQGTPPAAAALPSFPVEDASFDEVEDAHFEEVREPATPGSSSSLASLSKKRGIAKQLLIGFIVLAVVGLLVSVLSQASSKTSAQASHTTPTTATTPVQPVQQHQSARRPNRPADPTRGKPAAPLAARTTPVAPPAPTSSPSAPVNSSSGSSINNPNAGVGFPTPREKHNALHALDEAQKLIELDQAQHVAVTRPSVFQCRLHRYLGYDIAVVGADPKFFLGDAEGQLSVTFGDQAGFVLVEARAGKIGIPYIRQVPVRDYSSQHADVNCS